MLTCVVSHGLFPSRCSAESLGISSSADLPRCFTLTTDAESDRMLFSFLSFQPTALRFVNKKIGICVYEGERTAAVCC